MLRKLAIAICALGLSAGTSILGTPAHAQGVQVGTLTCNVASGFGFVFGSSRAINCTFSPPGGPPQHYVGSIDKFGVDIGYLQGGVIIWTVVAPTANVAPGSLAGTYAGATASATVGVGAWCQCAGRRFRQFDRTAAGQYRRHHRSQCCCRHRSIDPDFSTGLSREERAVIVPARPPLNCTRRPAG